MPMRVTKNRVEASTVALFLTSMLPCTDARWWWWIVQVQPLLRLAGWCLVSHRLGLSWIAPVVLFVTAGNSLYWTHRCGE